MFSCSILSYVNRHALLPVALRKRIELQDRAYISRVPYYPIGLLRHVKQLCGIKVELQDFQLANIAGLIATAWKVDYSQSQAATLLRESALDWVQTIRHRRITDHRLRSLPRTASIIIQWDGRFLQLWL